MYCLFALLKKGGLTDCFYLLIIVFISMILFKSLNGIPLLRLSVRVRGNAIHYVYLSERKFL